MDLHLIDKIIHERVRLAMMSALATRGVVSFKDMKKLLDVTDGNLSSNAQVLEREGLIRIEKKFVGKKPLTTYHMTSVGKKRFAAYIDSLEALIKALPKEE